MGRSTVLILRQPGNKDHILLVPRVPRFIYIGFTCVLHMLHLDMLVVSVPNQVSDTRPELMEETHWVN